MNIERLKTSFAILIVMAILQLLISIFLIRNAIIAILSVIAFLASIFGFFYVDKYNQR